MRKAENSVDVETERQAGSACAVMRWEQQKEDLYESQGSVRSTRIGGARRGFRSRRPRVWKERTGRGRGMEMRKVSAFDVSWQVQLTLRHGKVRVCECSVRVGGCLLCQWCV